MHLGEKREKWLLGQRIWQMKSSNNYSSWYDQNGNTQIASNTFLEGTINLVDEFGQFPSNVYLAVGKYNTDDNGIYLLKLLLEIVTPTLR